MSELKPWFERHFDFSFPAELLPNLLVRLRGTPARLEESFQGRRADVLTRKPEGGWSAQENAGHLADMEQLWLARVEDYVRGSNELKVTDLQNRRTDEANHNARSLELILSEFRAARVKLLKYVDEVSADAFSRSISHPRLKRAMRLIDHLYFVAEHDDHHLAQIWELLKDA